MIATRQKTCKPIDSDLFVTTIEGEPASKANSRRLVKIRERFAFIKSKKALAYSKQFEAQCPVCDTLYEEDLAIAMKIYYHSKRPDLDESLILDLLQKKVYKNDRSIKSKYILWGLDRKFSRTLIVVGPIKKEKEIISTLKELVLKEGLDEKVGSTD